MAVPRIDYLSRDYVSLRESMLDFATQTLPDWSPSSEGDFGTMLVEVFAYMGDILSHYTDRAQMENYLPTATQRESVMGIAYLLGYTPSTGSPATGTVTLVTDANQSDTRVPAGARLATRRIAALDGPVYFEVDHNPASTDGSWPVYGFAETTPAVKVTEGTTRSQIVVGESTGQPGQAFLVPDAGVYADTLEVQVEGVTWTRVEHLLDADATDNVFETYSDATSVYILFGDGINGAIPATGMQVTASYRFGVGLAGNVAVGAVSLIDDARVTGVHIAIGEQGIPLSGPMVGGSDPEGTESIRYNAPRSYRTQDRAVTAEDFKNIALGTEGVAKANVLAGSFTSVTLYVTGADGGAPGDSLLEAVARRFENRTLFGVTVTVAAPEFVAVNFGSAVDPIDIEVYPNYNLTNVREAVKVAIREYVANMPFGERMSVGKVYDVISGVDGVRSVDITVMARADATQSGVVTINPRPWEVFTVGDIHLNMTGGNA